MVLELAKCGKWLLPSLCVAEQLAWLLRSPEPQTACGAAG